jgi:hypothetical protein
MPFIDQADPILILGDLASRNKAGITNNTVTNIFRNLHTTVQGLHQNQVIIGDFNDMNILVKGTEAYCIDTDSYQFGGFPSTMYTAKYVDPTHCQLDANGIMGMTQPHNTATDWYAYTSLLFRSLLLIDPYGGLHQPKLPKKGIKSAQRAQHRIWAYDPDVRYPAFVRPLEVLPKTMQDYFKEVFVKDKREIFPVSLLANLHWQTCTVHDVEYATQKCPICHPHAGTIMVIKPQVTATDGVTVSPIFTTTGQILLADFSDGRLRYLYHENNAYYRETGEVVLRGPLQRLRYRISNDKTIFGSGSQLAILEANKSPERILIDTYRNIPVFDAKGDTLVWLTNGTISSPSSFGLSFKPQVLGSVVTDNSMLWTGKKFGFGYFTAGSILEGFIFSPHSSYTTKVDLPLIPGEIIDATAVFSDTLCWFMVQTKSGKSYINHAFAISAHGQILWQHSASPDDHDWLESIRGKTAQGSDLFSATIDGLQRIRLRSDGSVENKLFSATAPHVSLGDILHISHQGMYVQKAHSISLITLS